MASEKDCIFSFLKKNIDSFNNELLKRDLILNDSFFYYFFDESVNVHFLNLNFIKPVTKEIYNKFKFQLLLDFNQTFGYTNISFLESSYEVKRFMENPEKVFFHSLKDLRVKSLKEKSLTFKKENSPLPSKLEYERDLDLDPNNGGAYAEIAKRVITEERAESKILFFEKIEEVSAKLSLMGRIKATLIDFFSKKG